MTRDVVGHKLIQKGDQMLYSFQRFHGLLIRPIFLLAIISSTTKVSEAIDRDKFLNEYMQACENYEKRIENVVCKAVKRDAMRKSERQIVFSRAGGFEKMDSHIRIMEGNQTYHVEEVYCLGDDTLFQLFKAPGKEQFVLKNKGQTSLNLSVYDQELGDFLHASLGGRRFPIYKRMRQKNVVLAELSEPDPKTGFVKIKLALESDSGKGDIVAELDPSNFWAVISNKWRWEIKNTVIHRDFKVKYGPKINGFALPAVVEYEQRTEYLNPKMDDRVEHKATMEFTDWRFEKRPISEFQLTHYQLPDIPLKPKARTNWKFYGGLATIIILLLLIGLYFRSIARRKDGLSIT